MSPFSPWFLLCCGQFYSFHFIFLAHSLIKMVPVSDILSPPCSLSSPNVLNSCLLSQLHIWFSDSCINKKPATDESKADMSQNDCFQNSLHLCHLEGVTSLKVWAVQGLDEEARKQRLSVCCSLGRLRGDCSLRSAGWARKKEVPSSVSNPVLSEQGIEWNGGLNRDMAESYQWAHGLLNLLARPWGVSHFDSIEQKSKTSIEVLSLT